MHPVIMCPQGYGVESGANNSARKHARESVTDRLGAGWWQTIVRASHCMQLEVSESQYDSAGRKVCILQGTWLIENMKGNQATCLAHGQSAPSFHTGNIV